jgi:demethylmenaquinone methyltransferase/2-methoxy-6-polyprenyl-1,4-benzoquinol methylase
MTAAPPQVDKSGARVKRMFGQIAPRYDLMNHLLSGGVDCYWRWRTVRAVSPDGSGPILDVCTGTGDLAFAYAKRAGHAIPVVGTDFTHEMLVRAGQKADRRPSQTAVTFLEADTQQLPFPDDTFQIVCVAFGLRNVSDTLRGLREMARVCRPGGRVAVLEFSTPRVPLLGRLYTLYFRHVLPRVGQLIARNREKAYRYLPTSVSEFPEGEDLTALMYAAGLEQTHFHRLTGGIATLYIGVKSDSRLQ